MARPINRLSARGVQVAGAGYHADGGGLYLLVTKSNSASWVFRFRKHGRLREMGLGSAAVFTLAEARERAREARKLLADGSDPIDHRNALRGAVRRTWGEAVADYIDAHKAGWKTPQQAQQWTNSLAAYGPPAKLAVRDVTTAVVLDCLRSAWTTRTETASRVRGRIERVWSAERVAGNVSGENPARWRGHLEHSLPKPSKVAKTEHFAAMPHADVPATMAALRLREGLSAKALRFVILCACRTSEATGAQWPEFDLDAGLWTIPAGRMKAGAEHVVPMPPEAVAILSSLPRDKPPFPLSENAMLNMLKKGIGQPYTVHGFRSSFHDWASESDWPEHVIDTALAHTISDEVKAAYRRTKLRAKHQALLLAWGEALADRL